MRMLRKRMNIRLDDIKKIRAAQAQEDIRGAMPRYWEDVAIGEELTPVVFGPLTLNENDRLDCRRPRQPYELSDRMWRILYGYQHPGADLGFFDPTMKIKT